MTTTQLTETVTETVTRYFHIGPRTRRFRNGADMHAEIVEAVLTAAQYPGAYAERTEAGLRQAFAAACGYQKHIKGYRVDGTVIAKVNAMTAYQFAKMLDAMIAAGVSNTFEAEAFFKALA